MTWFQVALIVVANLGVLAWAQLQRKKDKKVLHQKK